MGTPAQQAISFISLVIIASGNALALKLSQNPKGGYDFSAQATLVLSEFVKVCLSFLLLYYEKPDREERWKTLTEVGKLPFHCLALAVGYAVNNVLAFWIFQRVDPGSVVLIKCFSTILNAILLYFWRNFILSKLKWVILITQMVGMFVSQFNVCSGGLNFQLLSYMLLALSVTISSINNIWNEYLVKNLNASLGVVNIYLYAAGVLVNLVWFLYNRFFTAGPAFFQGYNAMTFVVIIGNSFTGIAINAVYKYADALVRTLANSMVTSILVFVSGIFFGARLDAHSMSGAFTIIAVTYLYFRVGVLEGIVSR